MLGEAWIATSVAEQKLRELRDKRELLALSGEDNLHPFVFLKKLNEIDSEIACYESELITWEDTYQELIDAEVEELASYNTPDPEPFQVEFDELCQIDGIYPKEYFC